MRISTPSASSALLLAALAAATTAIAQDAVRDATRGGAKDRIAQEGAATTDRLKSVIGEVTDESRTRPDPRLPAPPGEELRRRAFDGLRGAVRSEAMDRRARDAVMTGEASLAREREAQARQLRQALGLEPGEADALAKAAPAPAIDAWVPVLFVSSSMPLPVLRNYAAQLERAQGILAFRGMPGGLHKVGPMAKLSAQILRLDPGCDGPACAMRNVKLIVDPILFRQHGIVRVPALAMVPGDPAKPYCERGDDSPRARHIVFGDSALAGLLEEYARLGGAKEVSHAQALLAPR